jgi:hypothetical protein
MTLADLEAYDVVVRPASAMVEALRLGRRPPAGSRR